MFLLDERKCCSITGHRPEKFKFKTEEKNKRYFELMTKMEECILQIVKAGKTTFYIGMSSRIDMWAGKIIVRLRESHKKIKLVGVIPYEKQSDEWSIEDKKRYQQLIKQCNAVFVLGSDFHKNSFRERNQMLVNLSSLLLAVYDEKQKRLGTGMTITMVEKAGLDKMILDANSFSVSYMKQEYNYWLGVEYGEKI